MQNAGPLERQNLLEQYAELLEHGFCRPRGIDDGYEWTDGLPAHQAAWVEALSVEARRDSLEVIHDFENVCGGFFFLIAKLRAPEGASPWAGTAVGARSRPHWSETDWGAALKLARERVAGERSLSGKLVASRA